MATGAGFREEVLTLLCTSPRGEAFGWTGQQGGRLVHDVCPSPGMETSLTSGSSSAELSPHTEDAFHPARGDYVSLLCLRNPDGVATTIASPVVCDLGTELVKLLSADRYLFHPDDSHIGGRSDRGPVLFGPSSHPI